MCIRDRFKIAGPLLNDFAQALGPTVITFRTRMKSICRQSLRPSVPEWPVQYSPRLSRQRLFKPPIHIECPAANEPPQWLRQGSEATCKPPESFDVSVCR